MEELKRILRKEGSLSSVFRSEPVNKKEKNVRRKHKKAVERRKAKRKALVAAKTTQ